MDKIRLTRMLFHGYHGTAPQERSLGQRFSVDLEVEADLRRAGESDDLRETVNYTHLYRVVREVIEGTPRNLLEALAGAITERLLSEFPIASVRVRVDKLSPPIQGAVLTAASVEICRQREAG